jgi:hypothetical protein
MKPVVLLQRFAIWLTCVGIALPNAMGASAHRSADRSHSRPPHHSAPRGIEQPSPVIDVALSQGGVLAGGVATEGAIPIAGAPVSIEQHGRVLARTASSNSGDFVFSDLQGGMYQIHSPAGSVAVRLWAPGTAPPAAQSGVLVIRREPLVRAQCTACGPGITCEECHDKGGQPRGPVMSLLRNPWVLATLIGAAIAVPIATHDHEIPPAS